MNHERTVAAGMRRLVRKHPYNNFKDFMAMRRSFAAGITIFEFLLRIYVFVLVLVFWCDDVVFCFEIFLKFMVE